MHRIGKPPTVPDFRRDIARLALALALVLSIAWSPYLFFGKTLLASASEVPSTYPYGAVNSPDSGFVLYNSLDAGAPGWQNEPWLAVQHHVMFDEHRLPMWNPYDAYGAPFAASMIAQPFYPLTFAVAIDPTPWTYNLLVVGRLFVLALGCALFVRLFAGFIPALIAGICGAFSGYFIAYADIVHIGVEAMLPWILLGVEVVVRRAGPRSTAPLAAAWGISLLGGMPESSALAAIVVGLYALFRVVSERSDKRSRQRFVWLVTGVGVGTAIAGIMLVPFLEYLSRDYDQHQLHPPGLAYDIFKFPMLLTEFAPLSLGPPVNSILTAFSGFSGFRGGPGTFAIFLATLAGVTAVGAWKQRLRADRVALFLALVGAAFEAKRYGVPLVQWIGGLPLARLSNFPKYGEADVAVCIACAAGLGVAAVLERRIGFWQIWTSLVGVLGLVSWLIGGIVLPPGTTHTSFFTLGVGQLLAILILTALAMVYARRTNEIRRSAIALVALATFEAAFGFFVPLFYLIDKPTSDARDPYKGAPYIRFLQAATARDGGRIVAVGAALFPDWAGAFGLYDTRALSAMYPERYLKFIEAFIAREPATFDDQFDRFTGIRPIDFDDPRVRQWMRLSSIQYIVSAQPAPPNAGSNAFLRDLWDQIEAGVAPEHRPALHPATALIDGVSENVLFDHPPNDSVAYTAVVPQGFPWLAVDLALDPAVWSKHCGGAVTFAINAVRADGKPVGTVSKTIDPKHRSADRHWNRMTLSLQTAGSVPVTLHFSTSVPPPGDTCASWALWGEPRWTAARDLGPYRPRKHQDFTHVPEVTDMNVYRVDDAMPRLALIHHADEVATGDAALQAIAAPNFDMRKTVVIEGEALPATGSADDDRVELIDRTSQRVEAEISTTSDAVLLQNDTWYPGWRATIDGRETPIARADYLFRGIAIPAGHHRVVIEYRAGSVTLGLAITFGGLFAFALLMSLTPAFRRQLIAVSSVRRAKA